MKRNLKALGLALMAVFAMSALMSASASAEPVTGHFLLDEEGSLTADEINGDHFFTTSAGLEMKCTESHFDGVGSQPTSSNTATVAPDHKGCSVKVSIFTFPATVDFTSCNYVFNGTASDMDIDCNPGDTIDISIYQNHTNHTAGTALCTLTVGEQTVDNGITYTNNAGTPSDVDVLANGAEFNMTRDGSSLCGAANQVGSYTGDATVTAFNKKGEAIDGEVG